MKSQNTVLLSLGTNMGDKLENLQTCISVLHKTVATVIKVSNVYETPAWGFEGAVFYNCAIAIHTHKSAQKLLSEIVKVEKKLGRIKTNSTQYESRCIDIDIIAFNDEIIESDTLNIPHLHVQNRKFVLFPLLDIAPKWKHPKRNQTISEMLISF